MEISFLVHSHSLNFSYRIHDFLRYYFCKKVSISFSESISINLQLLIIYLIHICILLAGHAFEARIYAENVPKGFLPATGVLNHYRPVAVSSSGAVQNCVYNSFSILWKVFCFLEIRPYFCPVMNLFHVKFFLY